jgi:hypothetical protein
MIIELPHYESDQNSGNEERKLAVLPPTLPPSLPSATAAGFFLDLSGAPVAISTTRNAFWAKSLLLERLGMGTIMPMICP